LSDPVHIRKLRGLALQVFILGGLLKALTIHAPAEGIRLNDQDAMATARGWAFTAKADNPSAIYYNPAGITQLSGQQVRSGAYGLTYQMTYRRPTGGTSESERALLALPSLYYTYSPTQYRISVGPVPACADLNIRMVQRIEAGDIDILVATPRRIRAALGRGWERLMG
jgi:hypothetical protein